MEVAASDPKQYQVTCEMCGHIRNGWQKADEVRERPQTMQVTSVVKIEKQPHQDPYLKNAAYISSSQAPQGKVYLRFHNDKDLKLAVGKNVDLIGLLTPVELKNGERVIELRVNHFEISHQQ